MPKDEFDPEDPHELVGVVVPMPDTEAAEEALGVALIEEFVRLGHDEDSIVRIFGSSFYAGAHVIYVKRGEAWVRDQARSATLIFRPMLKYSSGGSQ